MPGYRILCAALILATLVLAASSCIREPAVENRGTKILVVASILPLSDFARQVGGERVEVETLVPAAASPHTYELTPSQLRAVTRARVLVLNGVGLEYWAEKVISAASNPDLTVVTVSDGLKILAGDPDEPGGNPHTWLSPKNAEYQVEQIREAITRADPAGASEYKANADRYVAELKSLDQEIRSTVQGFSSRRFIAFHAAWEYFAADYGLEEAAVIERRPGQEPSPSEIAEIVKKAREISAKAIFAEPQFSPQAADAIAEECGARVLFLNPLGSPPDYHYLDLMRDSLKQMSLALR